jgi:hypothetical protein
MAWTTPVTDRTYDDIANAKAQIAAWLAAPGSAVTDLKGCLNVSDTQRIFGNMQYVSDALNMLGYSNSMVPFPAVSYVTVPTADTLVSAILGNLRTLVAAAPQALEIDPVPFSMNTFGDVNTVERVELLLKQFLDFIVMTFRYSGTVVSGDR